LQRALVEPEVACPRHAAERARETRDPQANAADGLCRVLEETDAPLAQRARAARCHHVDLSDRLDEQGSVWRTAGLESGKLLEVAHQLRQLARSRASTAARPASCHDRSTMRDLPLHHKRRDDRHSSKRRNHRRRRNVILERAMGLTLYAETLWISPYAFSSFVALHEKAVPFEIVEVSLLDLAHREPAYRDRSVTARVPALEHDGFWLAESSAIAEYLEETFPQAPRLLPAASRDRARARQLMAWFRSDLSSLREERSTASMIYEHATAPLSAAAAADAEKLLRVADALLPARGGPLFGAWCLVDAELAFMLHRLILNGDPVPPRVHDIATAELRRPAARAFMEHPRPKVLPPGYTTLPWNVSATPAPSR
jgi:glutathione S-transferase